MSNPPKPAHPQAPGVVMGPTDTEGRPVDGNTGSTGAGAVLTVGTQRIFIPYGAQ